jgi:predicted metal-dependent hydrolase
MAFVEYDSWPQAGERVALNKIKIMFGRHQACDGVIVHPTVSREHFFIEQTGGKFFLVDQGSGNGTYVNDERVSWVELRDGDKIQAGPFTLIFKNTDEPDQVASSIRAGTSRPGDSYEHEEQQSFDRGHERIYPREYLKGIECFNSRDYFDAHEVWEEIWLRSTGEAKLFYQMLIQAAVGLHHYERDNYRGARGLYRNVVEKLQRLPSFYMSLDLTDFSSQLRSFFSELTENELERPIPADRPRPTIHLLGSDTDDYAS